jgi:hypothetical protein
LQRGGKDEHHSGNKTPAISGFDNKQVKNVLVNVIFTMAFFMKYPVWPEIDQFLIEKTIVCIFINLV